MKSLSKTLILIVLVIILAQSIVHVTQTYHSINKYKKEHAILGTTGKAAGVVNLCINSMPTLDLSGCSNNATQDQYYTCWVFGSDSDNNNLTFSSEFTEAYRTFNSSTEAFFNVSLEGYVNFTPTNEDVGNFIILFTVDDGTGCSNSQSSENFSLEVINVNDAPYLIEPIPNQSMGEGDTLYAFYLDDYFADPDNDDLTYSVLVTSSAFTVTIDSFTSRVSITATACDSSDLAIFTATDPYSETASSNWVRIECTEEQQEEEESGTGEGSGGGGGSGSTRPCKSEYECYDFHKCNSSNVKVQKCVDINGCDDAVFLVVPCTYEVETVCNESWECSEWGVCLPNGTQTRTCTDLNKCTLTEKMPDLVQKCEYIGTCDDGIKNCHDGSCEEGIDCGGFCAACKSIEVPYPFEEEKSILIYVVTGVILMLLTSVLLYHYFRKEINAALAKAGWIINKRKKKQFLLTNEEKKKLLVGLLELEQKLSELEAFHSLNKFSELIRYYFMCVYDDSLTPEFDLEELKDIINKKKAKIREVLRKIFVSSFAKYLAVEQNKALITKRNIILMMEELRNLVLQTSKVEAEDVAKEVKEIEIPTKAEAAEKTVIMITNAYIALQYVELEIAKKKYLELIADYEKLSVKDQESVFEDISRLYHNISYVNSWLAKPKEV
jgi:hypothetical protein